MTPESVLKTPAGLLSVTVDFTGVILPANTSLASYSVDLDPALEVVDATMTSTRVTLEIKGGVLGSVYTVRVLGTANKPGLQAQESFTVRVVSALSEEVLAPNPPSEPRNAVATVSGTTVTFEFTAPESLGSPADVSYTAHLGPGIQDRAVSASPAVFLAVPYGTYTAPYVVASNSTGAGPRANLPAVTVGDVAPTFASDPFISGTALPDQQLTGTPGTFTDGQPGQSFWLIENAEGSNVYVQLQTALVVSVLEAHRGRNLRLVTLRTYNGGTQQVSRVVSILVPKVTLTSVMPPVIATLMLGSAVGWVQGTYTATPDSLTTRLFKTMPGGSETEVVRPYTPLSSDNGASFRVIEYPVKAGQSPAPNPSAPATLTLLTHAEPLLSVSAVADNATGTVTYVMVPKPGQTPTQYMFGDVGGTMSSSPNSTVTVAHALGTFTPQAQAIVGSAVSTPITGTTFTLVAPLRVTGDPVITNGNSTEGAVLSYSGPSSSGVASRTQRWLKNGTAIAGQTGATLNTIGHTGSIAVEVTLIGDDGTSDVRTSLPVTISAVSGTAPSAPQALRIGTTSGDGLPITMDAPVSAGSTAITSYKLTYSIGGGAAVTVTQASRNFLLTGLAAGDITFSAVANNGADGTASGSFKVRYQPSLSGQYFFVRSAVDAMFVQLTDLDRTRGTLRISDFGSLAGDTITIKDGAGGAIATRSGQFAESMVPITTQRSLVVTGTTTAACWVFPYYFIYSSNATVQMGSPPVVGGVISVVSEAQFSAGFNPAIMQRQYSIYASEMDGTGAVLALDGVYFSGPSFTIPDSALGKKIGVSAWVYEPATGTRPSGISAVSATAGQLFPLGPVLDAFTGASITQATDGTNGISTPITDIPGFIAAEGVRITVTAATDASGTGGFWVAAHTADGLTIGLTTVGTTEVGGFYDVAPPNSVLPANTDAIVVGPAGSGTFSYTLTFSALGSAAVAGAIGLLGHGSIGLLGQGVIGLI